MAKTFAHLAMAAVCPEFVRRWVADLTAAPSPVRSR